MSLTAIGSQFSHGGKGLTDGTLARAIRELQGLSINAVTGAAAGTAMTVSAIRPGDTILAAILLNPTTTLGVAEIQTITINASSGTYTITWNGQTTAAIAFNAVAATVQTALENLSNIEVGDVVVTGGVGASGGGTPYTLTWASRLGNVAQPTINDVDLAGGGDTGTPATTTAGVQQLGAHPADIASTLTIQSVKASGTITFSGGVPTNGQTLVVGGTTFTMVTAGTETAATHIPIGADSTDGRTAMATALAAAINANEARLLPNGGGFRAPTCVATSDLGVVTVTAVVEGAGNGPTVTDTGSTITVVSTDPGAVTATFASAGNNDALTVNGVTFTIKTTVTDTVLQCSVKGTDTLQAAEMARAINAYQNSVGTLGVTAVAASGVVTISAIANRSGNSIQLTEACSNVTASGSGYLAGGTATGSVKSTLDLTSDAFTLYWYNHA